MGRPAQPRPEGPRPVRLMRGSASHHWLRSPGAGSAPPPQPSVRSGRTDQPYPPKPAAGPAADWPARPRSTRPPPPVSRCAPSAGAGRWRSSRPAPSPHGPVRRAVRSGRSGSRRVGWCGLTRVAGRPSPAAGPIGWRCGRPDSPGRPRRPRRRAPVGPLDRPPSRHHPPPGSTAAHGPANGSGTLHLVLSSTRGSALITSWSCVQSNRRHFILGRFTLGPGC